MPSSCHFPAFYIYNSVTGSKQICPPNKTIKCLEIMTLMVLWKLPNFLDQLGFWTGRETVIGLCALVSWEVNACQVHILGARNAKWRR